MCHSVLDRNWQTTTSVRTVLDCVYGLLLNPDVDDPLDSNLALAFYDDSGVYEAQIVEHTRLHAAARTFEEAAEELLGKKEWAEEKEARREKKPPDAQSPRAQSNTKKKAGDAAATPPPFVPSITAPSGAATPFTFTPTSAGNSGAAAAGAFTFGSPATGIGGESPGAFSVGSSGSGRLRRDSSGSRGSPFQGAPSFSFGGSVNAFGTITSVEPSFGPMQGGVTVTITGQRLGSGDVTSVTFDGVAALILSQSSTVVTVRLGDASGSGNHNGVGPVVVTSASRGTTTLAGAFEYRTGEFGMAA